MSFPFTTLIKQPRHNLGQLNVLKYTSIICQGVYFTAEPQNALFRVWSPFSVAFLAGVCVCVCARVCTTNHHYAMIRNMAQRLTRELTMS